MNQKYTKAVLLWLGCTAFTIVLIIIVGGLTRLTHSGLSMVEWKPVTGILPPFTTVAWHDAFELYKKFPEFKQVNFSMTLIDFKYIYYWEYTHRLLGRLVGCIYLLPFMYFIKKSVFGTSLKIRMIGVGVLGACQGVLGWYMVKSGLVNIPSVSHLRLASHLSLAVFLLMYILWLMMDIAGSRHVPVMQRARKSLGSFVLVFLIALQIIYGAFVSGLRAGFLYNTFPLMGGELIPSGVLSGSGFLLDLVFNPIMVQFIHRCLGCLIFIYVGILWIKRIRFSGFYTQKKAVNLLAFIAVCQVLLGIVTLVFVVPVTLASLHQLGAIILLTSSIYLYRIQIMRSVQGDVLKQD
jgi:heme a synthase